MKPKRYFLDQDNDCHWYLVDADRRAEWEAFVEEAAPDGWEVPGCATRLAGGPSNVTFERPEEQL